MNQRVSFSEFTSGLKETTSSINQIADHNKSLIDQTRVELKNLIQRIGDGKTDNNDDGLNAIKEHLVELETRGSRTSMALNDLSSGVYNELKAKQVGKESYE